MTYNYPKTNENNEQYFNSPPLEYKTSTFPTNIKPPPFPNEVHDNEKKSTYVIPLTKKRMLSCLSFKLFNKILLNIIIIRYWTPYFDLSTKEFGKRVLAALIPCTGDSFFILLQGKPDL